MTTSSLEYLSQPARLIRFFRQQTLLVVFLALVIFFSLLTEHFAAPNNILLILLGTAPLAIIVAGQTLVIITGGIDLSVGSVAALTSILAAKMMSEAGRVSFPPLLAIGVALVAATFIGSIHGWLIAKKELSPFIVTFASMSFIKGLALVISNGSPISIPHGQFSWMWHIGSDARPAPIFLMIGIFVSFAYILRNTKLGRYAYAIGGNETVALMSGVQVNFYKIQVYSLNALMAGLAGILLMTRIESGVYTIGENYALTSIAAVVIGGTRLRGGKGSIWGSLVGALLLTSVEVGLSLLNVSSLWNATVIGGLILVAALLDVERRKLRDLLPASRIERPIKSETDLFQVFNRMKQLITQQMPCEHVRLYMTDWDTGDLIQQNLDSNQHTIIDQPTHLAKQVGDTRTPLWVDDLLHEPNMLVEPMRIGLQSAIAVPIIHANRLVGVLELQGSYPKMFSPMTARLLTEVTEPVTPALQEAWLLETGWFQRHIRDALRHLWDEIYLSKCDLANWAYAVESNGLPNKMRGQDLQQILLQAVEAMGQKDHSRDQRRYQILYQTYIQGLTVDEITDKLSISRRQYFYDLKEALEAVTHLVINHDSLLKSHLAL
ncbi:MAG: GAF domain-containing protein [Chloroflexi bacterium]|nr:GAF domain-containing protein [Chloroflexota bacterium]